MDGDREITGTGFLNHLEAIGVLRPGSKTRRVIIDAAYNSAVFVYVEELGTERLLELQSPDVMGMEVVMVEKEDGEVSEGRRYFSTNDYCHDCKVSIEWTDDSHREQGHHLLSDSLKESDGAE